MSVHSMISLSHNETDLTLDLRNNNLFDRVSTCIVCGLNRVWECCLMDLHAESDLYSA